jgi:hypothetical protein
MISHLPPLRSPAENLASSLLIKACQLYKVSRVKKEAEMSREKPQAQAMDKHPEEYRRDLNPDALSGQNIGVDDKRARKTGRTAYDVKQLHRERLDDLQDDALKQITVLDTGERLKQGATYIDLNDRARGEITATGDMIVTADNLYVAKDDTPYWIWNMLIGVENPERLDTGNMDGRDN